MNKEEYERACQFADGIIDKLIDEYNLDKAIFYQTRREPYPTIKEVLCYVIHQRFNVSYGNIGKIFKRTHSTIIQGIRRAESYLQICDATTKDIYDKILLIEKIGTMAKDERVYISMPCSASKESHDDETKRADVARMKFKAQGFTNIIVSKDLQREKSNEWIGARISELLKSDIVVFASGWYDDTSCQLEKDACTRFNIEHFTDGKI